MLNLHAISANAALANGKRMPPAPTADAPNGSFRRFARRIGTHAAPSLRTPGSRLWTRLRTHTKGPGQFAPTWATVSSDYSRVSSVASGATAGKPSEVPVAGATIATGATPSAAGVSAAEGASSVFIFPSLLSLADFFRLLLSSPETSAVLGA